MICLPNKMKQQNVNTLFLVSVLMTFMLMNCEIMNSNQW